MRALTVVPLQEGSAAVVDVDEPEAGPGELLVDGIALGVCGTDREIVAGEYGWAPAGRDRLILGHESLGRVRTAPPESGFAAGDLVVGVVRRPDPDPCPACARGEFDMCRNGRYTERGIKELDGSGSERWTVETDYAVKLDPELERVGVLMEPASVLAKAWEHVERIGSRAYFAPQRPLVAALARSACLPRCSPPNAVWRCTCSTASRRAPSPISSATSAPRTHLRHRQDRRARAT
jgi:threonine dehydrogenase-like Zn-dependent dehydrogenase